MKFLYYFAGFSKE